MFMHLTSSVSGYIHYCLESTQAAIASCAILLVPALLLVNRKYSICDSILCYLLVPALLLVNRKYSICDSILCYPFGSCLAVG